MLCQQDFRMAAKKLIVQASFPRGILKLTRWTVSTVYFSKMNKSCAWSLDCDVIRDNLLFLFQNRKDEARPGEDEFDSENEEGNYHVLGLV